MDEEDKFEAYRISEEVQRAIEFYVNHSNRSMQTIIGKTLIAPDIPCWIDIFKVANDLTG